MSLFFIPEGIHPLQAVKRLEAFGSVQIGHTWTWSLHISIYSTWLNGNSSVLIFFFCIYRLRNLANEFILKFCIKIVQVVQYVGEIVGQRVADKREIEYQSGKRQQYKSACYFFKIDREHIIDATRKGGIARFVNHSCQVTTCA